MKFSRIILLSLILTSCSTGVSEPTTFDNCPKLDLSTITVEENSAQYMDEVAKLVQESVKDLVGKSEKNVEYCAAFEGLTYRVAARDGEFYALTMDYSPTRINVEIEKEVVTNISVG
ncbi:MAG: hypothetical protein ACKOMW_00425 [Actinomycetes bacterium]